MSLARGFTLVELIVVLAIFAVFAIMAYAGLDTVLTGRARVAQAFTETTALQKAYVRLRDDFQQLRARPIRDGFGEEQPALLVTLDGTLEFTRGGWRNPLSLPRPGLERIAYRLDEQRRLMRLSWRVLDRAPDSQPVELAVLERVERVDWRFLDASGQWHPRWPAMDALGAPLADPVPRAVELTLALVDLGEIRLLFSARNGAPR